MSAAALAKLAIPAGLMLLAVLAGGSAKADVTKPYDAGYAHGKHDAISGLAKDPNPASKVSVVGATAAEIDAYNKGYSDGYEANKKITPGPGGGGGTVTNKYDLETAAQAQSRGYKNGLDDGRQDGSSDNGYGYTHTKSPYTSATLKAAYESQWNAGYAKGYAEGVKHKEGGGGIIIGETLGTRGRNPSEFKPHSNVATGGWPRESLHRRDGYPRFWYNM